MNIKKEIELLTEKIEKIYKEYELASGERKNELSEELEKLNKRLKILNMLLNDLALTKIIDDEECIDRIYNLYLEKLKNKLNKLNLEQEELKKLIDFDQELIEQVILSPLDIREYSYRNLKVETTRNMLQQFMGSNLNLIKEKIELIGVSPVKEFALRLLNRANEISVVNLNLRNDEQTKYAIHLIQVCAYSLNLDSDDLAEFINQDKILFQGNVSKDNKTFLELNDKYEVKYVDNNRLVQFTETILSNKNKFIDFVLSNEKTKTIFTNKDIINNFFHKISRLKSEQNYTDLVVLLKYYLVLDSYGLLVEYITGNKTDNGILESAIIETNFINSNANERANLYHNNQNRIKSLIKTLEEKKSLSLEAKKEEIVNLLNGTILRNIKSVNSYEVGDLRSKLVTLQRELEEFTILKNEYKEVNNVLHSLRSHPETKKMRELLELKAKLNNQMEEISKKLLQYKEKLLREKDSALVDGKIVNVDSTRKKIEKLERSIQSLNEDIGLIKKEIEKYESEKAALLEQSVYVDSNGNEKKTTFSKLIFKMSKTFKDNESNKEKNINEINHTIDSLIVELQKREAELEEKEALLKSLNSSLNDDVIYYDTNKKEAKKLFDEFNEKASAIEKCREDIEKERTKWQAKRLEQLENRLMELTIEYPNKYKVIKQLLNSIDRNKLELLAPDLYTSLVISMECYEDIIIEDELLDELADIEFTMSDIEDKYIDEEDIYEGLISGKINSSQLNLEESEKIIMEDEDLGRKL